MSRREHKRRASALRTRAQKQAQSMLLELESAASTVQKQLGDIEMPKRKSMTTQKISHKVEPLTAKEMRDEYAYSEAVKEEKKKKPRRRHKARLGRDSGTG